jgi:ABC-type amino acid transport substrate-binding protein
MSGNQGVLLATGVPKPATRDQLKQLQVCAQSNTTGLAYVQKLRPKKAPRVFAAAGALLQALAVRQCDAVVLDMTQLLLEAKQNRGRYGALAGQIDTNAPEAAIFPKGSKLTQAVDPAIKQMRDSGTLARLQRKWFGVNFNKVPFIK